MPILKKGLSVTGIRIVSMSEYLKNQAMFQLVLDSIPSRVFWKDKNLYYVGGNDLFIRDAGLESLDELIGKSDEQLCWSKQQAEAFRLDDLEVLNTGKAKEEIQEPQNRSDGSTAWIKTNKLPLYADNGEIIGVLGTYTDITDQIEFQNTIEYQANFDSLTLLPNRLYLQNLVDQYVCERHDSFAGVMFIDLDYFKTVNDSLGHEVGDSLLIEVANRIGRLVPVSSTVARLGGDEFAILYKSESTDAEHAKTELETLANNAIAHILLPYYVNTHIVYLGASVGITFISSSAKNSADVFREADIAMYVAKQEGRNTAAFFSDSMRIEAEYKHVLQSQLRKAMVHGEFTLVYQPQYVDSAQIIGAEALIRWRNPKLGVVRPDDFIALAEQTGMIHSIGRWVFEEAFIALKTSFSTVPESFNLAINVSPVQFQHDDIVANIETLIKKHDVSAHHIQLEITETCLLSHENDSLEKIHRLKALGMTIALDDFGTGYSSLSYLTNLPIDKIKIDQSFIRKVKEGQRYASIVESIITMSQNLGIEVIAEGVETQEEKEFLNKKGCYQYQGYFFSRPVDEKTMKKMLEKK